MCAFLPLMLISPLSLTAEKFPTKPIQIVIPFAPGATDSMIRPFADRMGEFLGQSVVLNFKPGAGGGIGAGGCKECILENTQGISRLFEVEPRKNQLHDLRRNGHYRLRPQAVFSLQRLKSLPDVPTLRDLGYKIAGPAYYGISAPKGTPKEVIDQLYSAAQKTVEKYNTQISGNLK